MFRSIKRVAQHINFNYKTNVSTSTPLIESLPLIYAQPYLKTQQSNFSSHANAKQRHFNFFAIPKYNTYENVKAALAEDLKAKEKALHYNQSTQMMIWLQNYVGENKFLAKYSIRSLVLIAEATYWIEKLDLAPLLAKLSFAELKAFKPMTECMAGNTERSRLLAAVCTKLERPKVTSEAAYALREAAWCVFVHQHGYDELKQEEANHAENIPASPRPC